MLTTQYKKYDKKAIIAFLLLQREKVNTSDNTTLAA